MSLHITLTAAADRLSDRLDRLTFADPVTHVYNPLRYAAAMHRQYLGFARPSCRTVLLGMNPGPWGMAQTGVPFGEVSIVRDWLDIADQIDPPPLERQNPKRPILGLACDRSEVSGSRLWGLMRERFDTPAKFFTEHFVLNYCPLVFMESSGRNRTPDKLPAAERAVVDAACDEHLASVVAALDPVNLVGVGVYAEKALARVAAMQSSVGRRRVCRILHPSPASPAANRGWGQRASEQLFAAGVW